MVHLNTKGRYRMDVKEVIKLIEIMKENVKTAEEDRALHEAIMALQVRETYENLTDEYKKIAKSYRKMSEELEADRKELEDEKLKWLKIRTEPSFKREDYVKKRYSLKEIVGELKVWMKENKREFYEHSTGKVVFMEQHTFTENAKRWGYSNVIERNSLLLEMDLYDMMLITPSEDRYFRYNLTGSKRCVYAFYTAKIEEMK